MRNDQTGASGSGGWPQVQWARAPEASGEPGDDAGHPPWTPTRPEHPSDEAGPASSFPGPGEHAPGSTEEDTSTGGLVLPDGYIYDAEGYAHPVYGGYVYDDEGTAYPVESLVSGTIEPPSRPLEQAPPTARTADSFTFDRFTTVDPAKWGFGDGGGLASRSAARQQQRFRRRRRLLAGLVAALAVVAALGVWIGTGVAPQEEPEVLVTQPVDDFPGPGTGSVEVVINPGDGPTQIAEALVDAGVVKTTDAFLRAAAEGTEGIQEGTYTLLHEMQAAEALVWLLDPANKIELKVTIPVDSTVEQVLRVLSAKTQIPLEELEEAAQSPRRLGVPKDARKQLEGWLFPDTYTVQPGDSAEDVLAAMVSRTRRVLERLDVPEDEWEEVLTKASLVERVIPRAKDRSKAARVIQTRLEKGMPLQIDATLAYGLGKSPAELTVDELLSEHRYNTRVQTGLPPTPIGSPSRGAIRAVVNPAEGPWEYWVTVNPVTGETLFSESYAEYLEHTELLDEWVAENEAPDDDADVGGSSKKKQKGD